MGEGRDGARIENTEKRVRVQLGGEFIADSTRVKLVWERPYYPTYYFPSDDVRMDLMTATGETVAGRAGGTAKAFTIETVRAAAPAAARVWDDAAHEEIKGFVSFEWQAMDHWFEEDEEVFVHARDPYTRVDILQSSRHVRVEIDGVVVAETTKPRLLFETGLPVRYYIPMTDVDMTRFTPTDTATHCPYKGTARYWSAEIDGQIHPDIVWSYPTPLPESAPIAGFLSFYNEKVDLVVDGERQQRPKTVFS